MLPICGRLMFCFLNSQIESTRKKNRETNLHSERETNQNGESSGRTWKNDGAVFRIMLYWLYYEYLVGSTGSPVLHIIYILRSNYIFRPFLHESTTGSTSTCLFFFAHIHTTFGHSGITPATPLIAPRLVWGLFWPNPGFNNYLGKLLEVFFFGFVGDATQVCNPPSPCLGLENKKWRVVSFFFSKAAVHTCAVRLSLGRRLVNLLPVARRINAFTKNAACKVEFQPFKRLYSQLTFFNFL